MRVICVDDEVLMLNQLKKFVERTEGVTEVMAYDDELDALEWVEKKKIDVAFLDIHLHEMPGIELAEKILEIQPDVQIVFCTGYMEYAVKILNKQMLCHYLMKPVLEEEVQDILKQLSQRKKALLTVKMTEDFAVFDQNGERIRIKRRKAAELLEELIRHNGEYVPTWELCESLWKDNDLMSEKNKEYLWTLFSHLRQTLQTVGKQEILKKNADGYAVDMKMISIEGKGSYTNRKDVSG